jgi:hypothetical protein
MERFGNVMHADAVLEGHESAQRWQPKGGLQLPWFSPTLRSPPWPTQHSLFTHSPVETVELSAGQYPQPAHSEIMAASRGWQVAVRVRSLKP